MALDDINSVFAKLAGMVDETNATKNPIEFAAVTAGLALARTIVTDLRRIADALEGIATGAGTPQPKQYPWDSDTTFD